MRGLGADGSKLHVCGQTAEEELDDGRGVGFSIVSARGCRRQSALALFDLDVEVQSQCEEPVSRRGGAWGRGVGCCASPGVLVTENRLGGDTCRVHVYEWHGVASRYQWLLHVLGVVALVSGKAKSSSLRIGPRGSRARAEMTRPGCRRAQKPIIPQRYVASGRGEGKSPCLDVERVVLTQLPHWRRED